MWIKKQAKAENSYPDRYFLKISNKVDQMDLEAADVAHEETPPSYDQNYEQTPITAGTEINIHSGQS